VHGDFSVAATIRKIAKKLPEYIPMSDSACAALLEAREHDPFSVLGLHADGAGWRLRVLRPQAKSITVALADGGWAKLTRRGRSDLFEWRGAEPPPRPWRLNPHVPGW